MPTRQLAAALAAGDSTADTSKGAALVSRDGRAGWLCAVPAEKVIAPR